MTDVQLDMDFLDGLGDLDAGLGAVAAGGALFAGGLADALKLVGKRAWWTPPVRQEGPRRGKAPGDAPMQVEVWIRDLRSHYGTVDYCIEPVAGRGDGRWVRADSLTFTIPMPDGAS